MQNMTDNSEPLAPVPLFAFDEDAVWRLLGDLWRQYPRWPSTFGPCSRQCLSGHAGRGSGPCKDCIEADLAKFIGEDGARQYHSAIQRVRALEKAMFRRANNEDQPTN